MSDPNIGRLLGKRYQLQELIGTGAMGRVYRAKDILLGGVPVAIKFLSLSIQNKKIRLHERFEREAKTCALLGQRSIHIVRVMDYGVDEHRTPYYVMEYLEGKSLSQIIRRQEMTLTRFINMIRHICLGLQCAHNGIPIDKQICPIIHRDIKPSNMLVMSDATFGELVKILDFGIAKLLQSNTDQTNYYLGTLAYSSPEQMEGKELDNRSDIYSLGIMMFEMLTGKLPLVAPTHSFGAWYKAHHYQTPRSFADIDCALDLPQELEQLVMQCLEKEPQARPQNINEILTAIGNIETSLETPRTTQTPSPIDDTQQPTVIGAVTHQSKQSESVLPTTVSADDIFKQVSWPKNKPIADIVFPQPIQINGEKIPALWMMLPQAEINKRLVCTRYNQFLFITAPHPMILWITVIFNRKHGAKWLPYYIDLKTKTGPELISQLCQSGYYRILLFSREQPHSPNHILTSTIASVQCQRLQSWLEMSQTLPASSESMLSKTLLKNEYHKIKPQILAKLAAIKTDSPFDLSA